MRLACIKVGGVEVEAVDVLSSARCCAYGDGRWPLRAHIPMSAKSALFTCLR